MSAILHCIVTDIENSRMKDQLRAWKENTNADPLIQKIRRLERRIEKREHRAERLGAHIVHSIGSSINDADGALDKIRDAMYSRENDWNFDKYTEYYEEACRETPLPEVIPVEEFDATFLNWDFVVCWSCDLEDDYCDCVCNGCNSKHNESWIGCELCDYTRGDYCYDCEKVNWFPDSDDESSDSSSDSE